MEQNVEVESLDYSLKTEMLKYPILLVHGMGFRDRKRINYWGRIPQILEQKGCKVFFGKQDANGSIENNALQVAKALESALEESGASKVNIVAHSKGGLEARYLVSQMGYADKIASITTLSTPHHGSITIDKLLRFLRPIIWLGSKCSDLWFRILGDKKPNTYGAICSFETKNATVFNLATPDSPNVYYQSYAFVMKHFHSDIFVSIPSLIVKLFDGQNDGVLTPDSVKWGEFRGIYSGTGNRGISHLDEIDFRRKKLSKKSGEGISDITTLYVEIVENLAELGF